MDIRACEQMCILSELLGGNTAECCQWLFLSNELQIVFTLFKIFIYIINSKKEKKTSWENLSRNQRWPTVTSTWLCGRRPARDPQHPSLWRERTCSSPCLHPTLLQQEARHPRPWVTWTTAPESPGKLPTRSVPLPQLRSDRWVCQQLLWITGNPNNKHPPWNVRGN